GSFRRVDFNGVGEDFRDDRSHRDHLQAIWRLVDTDAVRGRQFSVFVDANHGAGGPLAERLLGVFECKASVNGVQTDGRFEHEPEPIPENLTTVSPMVADSKSNVGFVLDPDADRLAIFDETGRFIGEELTLALAVKYRLGQQRGPVAANMSTSRVIDDIAQS